MTTRISLEQLLVLFCTISNVISFTPDTTGLYDKPGEPKFTVDYWQKLVHKDNLDSAKVSRNIYLQETIVNHIQCLER